jgi:hypothetical protein
MDGCAVGSLRYVVEAGQRPYYVVRCRCGWQVRSHAVRGLSDTALDHICDRRDDRAAFGFSPVVWLCPLCRSEHGGPCEPQCTPALLASFSDTGSEG